MHTTRHRLRFDQNFQVINVGRFEGAILNFCFDQQRRNGIANMGQAPLQQGKRLFCQRVTGPAAQPAERTNALLERLAALNVAVDARAAPRPILDWVDDGRRK